MAKQKQKRGIKLKTYKIKVEEHHIVEKTYYIVSPNKKEAIKRAKANDWDDATADDPTGNIAKIKVISTSDIGETSEYKPYSAYEYKVSEGF
tara:strand:+ start:157 stop:432 length:276 start_codon:yes stop_codon:yes gene_type:complete